jgi:MFS family permease
MDTTTSSDPSAAGRRALWHNRDYMLLWSGQVVSAIGSQVSGLALPLLVLALTGSPAQAGIIGALEWVPYLALSLPAGALADRWDRKQMMILCDTGRALTLGTVPLALATGHLSILQLYVVGLAQGMLFVFFNTAEVASLPSVVSAEQIPDATAQNQATWGISALLGPPIGGALFGLARAVPFLVDTVSYLASALSLLAIRRPFQGERAEPGGHMWTEIREGLTFLCHRPLLRFTALFSAAGDMLFSGIGLILIVLARQEMHASPLETGAIFAIAAVGGILGSLVAPRVQRKLRFGWAVAGTQWLIALLYPLFALAPNPLVLGAMWACIAVLVSVSNTVRFSFQLSHVPSDLQGRVNSVSNALAYGGLPVGIALTGLLLQGVGARGTVLAITLCLILLSLWASLAMRRAAMPVAGG